MGLWFIICFPKISLITSEIKKLHKMMDHYSKSSDSVFSELIHKLPEQMQEAMNTCRQYACAKDKRGMRYTKRWILECILMRIKSRKAYLHLESHSILPVPTLSTLNGYLKTMKPTYGFDSSFFASLKKKVSSMKPEERRGDNICYIYYFVLNYLLFKEYWFLTK